MESYLRFWRLFPRLALGAIFFSLVLLRFLGKESSTKLLAYLQHLDLDKLGNVSSGILIVIFLILFCSLGLFLLELVSYIIGLIVSFILRLPFLCNVPIFTPFVRLVRPISEELVSFLNNNKDDLLEFQYLKSASNPDLLDKKDEIRQLVEKAIVHISNFKNKELIEGIALYGSVTQDRKWLESVRDNINELYYLQITLLTILITIFFFDFDFLFLIFSIVLTLLFLFLLLSPIKERRKTYAFFILLSYLDNFTTWDSASMVDRDAV